MLTKEYLGYRQKHNNVIKVWSLIQSLIDIKSALNNEFHKGKEKIEREKKNCQAKKILDRQICFPSFWHKNFNFQNKIKTSFHKASRRDLASTWNRLAMCAVNVFMCDFFDPDQCSVYTIIQAKLKGREHHTTTGRRWQGRKLLEIITVAMLKLILKLCR